MEASLDSYSRQRDEILANVVNSLSKDERIVAAWITGSLGRNEADALSDIDISVAIADAHGASLCRRLEQVSAQTSPERYSLFSQFGTPALIHENNNNAPEGGTFTFVMYAESAIMVDWILVPQAQAKRPEQSKLLFEKAAIPNLAPDESEDPQQRKKSLTEMWAFFWMMTAVTIKYIQRNDGVFAAEWIERLHSLSREIERKLTGESWRYVRGSLSQLQTNRKGQLESLDRLYHKMLELKPKVTEFTGTEPRTPVDEIAHLRSLTGSDSEIEDQKSETVNPKS